MSDEPDFRSEKMESLEGQGIASARFEKFLRGLNDDVRAAAVYDSPAGLPPVFERQADAWAKEASELVGFWVTWHIAGGFQGLEKAGWHRATVFRKIRRFRTYFDCHPDEFKFDWITLNLDKAWSDGLVSRLSNEPEDSR